jgi:hypothetical protein
MTYANSTRIDSIQPSDSLNLLQPNYWFDLYGPFFVLAAVIILAIWWYLREGRNNTLERILVQSEFGSTGLFCETLAVAEHQPRTYLRLSKSTAASSRLQMFYRWVIGKGPQAIFDEVAFDGFRQLVNLKRTNKYTDSGFAEFTVVWMREVSMGRAGSLWHIDLLPRKGRAVPFVTSEMGDRRTTFEQTASLAKAVSAIMAVPVQVCVAGNVWTLGWPPRTSAVSKS